MPACRASFPNWRTCSRIDSETGPGSSTACAQSQSQMLLESAEGVNRSIHEAQRAPFRQQPQRQAGLGFDSPKLLTDLVKEFGRLISLPRAQCQLEQMKARQRLEAFGRPALEECFELLPWPTSGRRPQTARGARSSTARNWSGSSRSSSSGSGNGQRGGGGKTSWPVSSISIAMIPCDRRAENRIVLRREDRRSRRVGQVEVQREAPPGESPGPVPPQSSRLAPPPGAEPATDPVATTQTQTRPSPMPAAQSASRATGKRCCFPATGDVPLPVIMLDCVYAGTLSSTLSGTADGRQ